MSHATALFCTSCGRRNEAATAFCEGCGTAAAVAAPPSVESPRARPASVSPEQRKIDVAFHEAGHAVAARLLGCEVSGITIEAHYSDGSGGKTHWAMPFDGWDTTALAAGIETHDAVAVAGYVANIIHDDRNGLGDSREANHQAAAASDLSKIQLSAKRGIQTIHPLLTTNWSRVESVAEALLESPSETLTGPEFLKALNAPAEAKRAQRFAAGFLIWIVSMVLWGIAAAAGGMEEGATGFGAGLYTFSGCVWVFSMGVAWWAFRSTKKLFR